MSSMANSYKSGSVTGYAPGPGDSDDDASAFGWLTGQTTVNDMRGINRETPVDDIEKNAYQTNGLQGMQNGLGSSDRKWGSAQQDIARSYADVLSGRAPSVAQNQLAMGQDSAMRQLQSASAAHPGMNSGLSQRNMLMAQGNLLGQGNGQASMLRAQEQDAARSGYGGLTAAARAGDQASVAQQYGMASNDRDAQVQYQHDRYNQQQHMWDMNYQRVTGNNAQSAQLANAAIGAGAAAAASSAGGGKK